MASHSKLSTPLAVHPIGNLVLLEFLFAFLGGLLDPIGVNGIKLFPLLFARRFFSQVELAQADLLDAESLDKAIAGVDYVVHTASPLPIQVPEDEQVVIKPAVEGTLAVLRAAHKHKVKRVVITSSGLTITIRKPEN